MYVVYTANCAPLANVKQHRRAVKAVCYPGDPRLYLDGTMFHDAEAIFCNFSCCQTLFAYYAITRTHGYAKPPAQWLFDPKE